MKRTLYIIFLILLPVTLKAQTFGFGCLGLSGFYGGYGIHNYEANGLNQNILAVYNQFPSGEDAIKFEGGTGLRFGANILRADFENVFVTAKGFFQFSKESESYTYTGNSSEATFEYELNTNHWGFGIDFGVPVFSFLDLKLVEGGITFYNIEFKEKTIIDNSETTETSYKSDDTDVGYYVGTGLIINLIEGYISLEGTAMYHFYSFENLNNEKAGVIPIRSINKPFIEKGGFGAAIQLNVGFPL